MYEKIKQQAKEVISEALEKSNLQQGDIFVIGCSSSTVKGEAFGTASSMDIAQALFDAIYPEIQKRGIYLAVQCCEHLNRAIITEKEAVLKQNREIVNVVPQPKAGGSFATIAYRTFREPCATEHIKADAGIDIGGVLIGMHLKEVAVPLSFQTKKIGEAHITGARTRAKFIGGERAVYDENMK